MLLTFADDLGAEGCPGARPKFSVVVLKDVKLLLDFFNSADSNITGLLEAIGYFKWMDASFQKFLSLLENGAREDDHTCGSISDLVVLRSGQLGQESCRLMVDLFKSFRIMLNFESKA